MDKVVMRDDLTWSDGKPITAYDVEFSFKVIMSKAVIIPAMRTGTDQIKYVKAYDDRTLVYFHKQAASHERCEHELLGHSEAHLRVHDRR